MAIFTDYNVEFPPLMGGNESDTKGDNDLRFRCCLVCANSVLKVGRLGSGNVTWFNNDTNPLDSFEVVFNNFCKLFDIESHGGVIFNGKEVETEQRFCFSCRDQIDSLVELQKQLEELEKKFKEGRKLLKQKLEGSEGFFQNEIYYRKDEKHENAQSLILKTKTVENSAFYNASSSSSPSEKSVVTLNSDNEFALKANQRVLRIVISAEDKAAADRYLSGVHVQTRNVGQTRPNQSPSPPIENDSSSDEYSDHGNDVKILSYSDQHGHREPSPANTETKKSAGQGGRRSQRKDEASIGKSFKKNINHKPCVIGQSELDINFYTSKHLSRCRFQKNTCTMLHVTLDKVNDDWYKCRLCGRSLRRYAINRHVISQHTNRTTCKLCWQRFNHQGNLISHIRRVHENIVKCPICSKPIASYNLLAHKGTHYSRKDKQEAIFRGERVEQMIKKNFKCDLCSKTFPYKYSLLCHKAAMHVRKMKKKFCLKCGKRVANFSKHNLKVHGGNKDQRFFFSKCNKTWFLKKVDLEAHAKSRRLNKKSLSLH